MSWLNLPIDSKNIYVLLDQKFSPSIDMISCKINWKIRVSFVGCSMQHVIHYCGFYVFKLHDLSPSFCVVLRGQKEEL
jgi:hypothetical protein